MRFSYVLPLAIAIGAAAVAADPKKKVHINPNDASDVCFILPTTRNTIGASEDGGDGAQSFCVKPRGNQKKLRSDIWKSGPHLKKTSSYIQVTGCINTKKVPTLISSDGGGQYDSNGGVGGRGNPPNTHCTGYASYVEVVEPDSGRICLRCCNDVSKCPLDRDTQGCASVIKNGNYNGC